MLNRKSGWISGTVSGLHRISGIRLLDWPDIRQNQYRYPVHPNTSKKTNRTGTVPYVRTGV
jgi:hypothetical protein